MLDLYYVINSTDSTRRDKDKMEILGRGTSEINSIMPSSEVLRPQVTTHILLNTAFLKNFFWPPVHQRLLTQKLL